MIKTAVTLVFPSLNGCICHIPEVNLANHSTFSVIDRFL